VLAINKDNTLRILASHGSGERRHRIIVPHQSTITQLHDLKGKRFGIKKGTSTYCGFLALLSVHNMSPAEMTITNLDPDVMPEALIAGSIDAMVASEPTPSLAEMRGGRELAHLGGLGSSYPLVLLAKARTVG